MIGEKLIWTLAMMKMKRGDLINKYGVSYNKYGTSQLS